MAQRIHECGANVVHWNSYQDQLIPEASACDLNILVNPESIHSGLTTHRLFLDIGVPLEPRTIIRIAQVLYPTM